MVDWRMIRESPHKFPARFVRYDYIYYDSSRCAVREPGWKADPAAAFGRLPRQHLLSRNGGTPVHHPFSMGILPYKLSIFGVPPFMETPI